VGSHIDVRHLAATPIGVRVTFRANEHDGEDQAEDFSQVGEYVALQARRCRR
jgi:predicted thioesterase